MREQQKLLDLLIVREALLEGARRFFQERGWTEVTTSILTSMTGSCENVESLFRLPYFESEAHLSQTSQIQLEYLVIRTGKPAWTITHSFRAEDTVDDRHLTEFLLIEPEIPGYQLHDIKQLQEELVVWLIEHTIDLPEVRSCLDLPRLEKLTTPFRSVTYSDALQTLNSAGYEVKYGQDLSSHLERWLLEWNEHNPLYITHFPIDLKFFNMKWSPDGRSLQSVDLLLPPFGEVSGGAEREETLPNLKRNIQRSPMFRHLKNMGATLEDFNWYFSLWSNGDAFSCAGFGMGFERLVGFFLGESNIGNCIEFPRNRERLAP